MSLGRAVPWASWEEWRQVGLWLLSEAPGDVQQGLDRVAAWRARGRVPLGVDSTACLVEAQLRDRAASSASATAGPQAALLSAGSSESELRLQYAMAVVRMVNGIADSAQRGRVAASVASLAAAAGLPRILVDLRHEATHNELPSLAALRLAAQHGLAWLQGNYWQRQSDHEHASTDKVRALVQEYLNLHLAAATKVAAAAAAAGDSEDSEEEDARPSAVAAAAAAAASMSAGRRAAGRGDAATDAAQQAASGGASAAGGYQAADAKRRRRQLLSEIRSAVPRPAAALVADALLTASAAQAAASGGQADASTSAGGAGVAAPAAVVERALAAALGHLTAIFPQLPPLLLLNAVRRLVAAAEETAGGAASNAAILPAHLRWLQRLLPSQAQAPSQQQHASSGSMLAAIKGWSPSTALLQQLLAEALPAHATAAQRAAWQALAGRRGSSCCGGAPAVAGEKGVANGCGQGSSGGSAEAASSVADILRHAVALLLAALGQCPGGKAAASLAALAPRPAAAAPPEAQPTAQLDAAANSQRRLLARLQQQEQQRQERRQQPTAKQLHAADGRGAAAQPPRKRWRRADSWQPCALGMLPCAADPNGRLPPLDPPAPLDLPGPFVEHLAAEAAAAAVAEAAAAAGSKAGQPREAQQSAAAALLQELREGQQQDAGPWPAPDRFTTPCAQPGGEEEPAALQAAPRVQLPHQVALLV